MSEVLLDSNVLIALAFTTHLHHRRATVWLQSQDIKIASCPITQGALARYAVRTQPDGRAAAQYVLNMLNRVETHIFWPDDVPLISVDWNRISGYGQVTDAYLVALARHRGGSLATLDEGLHAIFPDTILVGEDEIR